MAPVRVEMAEHCSFVHEDLDYKESLSGAFNECKLSHQWKSKFGSCSLSLSPAANMMSGVGSGSGVQVIDSPLLTQQIEAQRLCIKHLKNENNRLKVQVTSKPPQLLEFTIYLHDESSKT